METTETPALPVAVPSSHGAPLPGAGAPVRVYLAARYGRHREMRQIAETLRGYGMEVHARWTLGDHDLEDESPTHEQAAGFAMDDLEDLSACDWFIGFTESARHPGRSRGGRHVELGLAIALGKRVIIIGPRENVFCYLPHVEVFDSLEDFLGIPGRIDFYGFCEPG